MSLGKLPLCVSFLLLVIGAIALNRHIEAEGRLAYAAEAANAAVSGSCSDPSPAAFAPELTYGITWSAPAAATGPTCTGSLGITGAVNGDTAPSVTCSLASNGFVTLVSRTPTFKFGGLQCATQDRAILEGNGDGTDNLSFDIGMQPPADVSYDSAKKIDDNTAASKAMCFGSGGQVAASAIIDGDDYDGLVNGEIALGGGAVGAGGNKFFISVDVAGADVNITDSIETLTMTFTAQ